jgi:hypothetical protein
MQRLMDFSVLAKDFRLELEVGMAMVQGILIHYQNKFTGFV